MACRHRKQAQVSPNQFPVKDSVVFLEMDLEVGYFSLLNLRCTEVALAVFALYMLEL